jgi:Trypsin-like serine proteases, typically periplasmic, contain C-terminal PDZ domain
MKKYVLFSLFLLAAVSAFAQNLRDSVCIVKEEFSDETKNWLKETADYLNKKGYRKYGEVLNNLDGSTFGSGFVYIAPDGKSYIVTNRHVVPSCEMAVIQFEQTDGTYKEFKDLKIVSSNTDFDLALIELPAGTSNTGLRLATIPVTEGEEIWTAGFPGLAGAPSWQLGKGNVTNATTRIPDLIDPDVSTLIQHSAPTDPGNSGGPLLRKEPEALMKLSVLIHGR